MRETSCWGDGQLFNVSFTTKEKQQLNRMIVVENPRDKDDIRSFFLVSFPNVQRIDYIDECETVLLMTSRDLR
ncbi:hypothetical protein [uncultured Vagococcus sp.]|uniref:hypothetical protein n=1 Tax=uncultured Vagococcus sp. TaxID=189676 RepID=UPI0028D5AEDB|nr:hypothetical protein [uncultured Vagococcus sp.]